MNIPCFVCDRPLEEPGGLMFSPPDEEDRTTKTHLCRRCWSLIFTLTTEQRQGKAWIRKMKLKGLMERGRVESIPLPRGCEPTLTLSDLPRSD